MEKLIELLNEYRTEKLRREMYVNWADKEAIELSEVERINEYEVSQTLDSLNYLRLFIKWLVENDKINFYKWKFLEYPIWSNNYDECDYLDLIQWLAISDNPIDDLIYYLK
jgi:hypothetical protein